MSDMAIGIILGALIAASNAVSAYSAYHRGKAEGKKEIIALFNSYKTAASEGEGEG